MTRIYIVNEFNIWGMIFHSFKNGSVYISDTEALLRPLTPFLRLIVNLMKKTGMAQEVKALKPESIWISGLPIKALFSDYYPLTGTQLEKHFDIASRFSHESEYAYPSLKVLDNYQQHLINLVHLTDWLEDILPAGSWNINGLNSNYPMFHKLLHGRDPNFEYRPAPSMPQVVNGINLLSLYFYALGWLVIRTRWNFKQESYFLAVDSWAPYDKKLFEKLIDKPEEILIYQRDRGHCKRDIDEYSLNRKCLKEDGFLRPHQSLKMLLDLWRDIRSVWSGWKNEDPKLFSWLIALPLKRSMAVAFFNRFSVRYFWGRDDYSVDHILRNQELRRAGGTSLGINHGLPVKCLNASWKHIDFDIYYSIGGHLYETYYKEFWRAGIIVRPIGSTHIKYPPIHASQNMALKDIVYFVNPRLEAKFFMAEVFKVARYFPDRKIMVKVKPGRQLDGSCVHEMEMLNSAPPNVMVTHIDSYELMEVSGYVISTGSTIVAEALQHRLKAFVLDGEMNGEYFYFRDFPGLCVLNGEEIIRRIEDIESGKEISNADDYSGLIDMSDAYIPNIIRADMGLPLIETSIGAK